MCIDFSYYCACFSICQHDIFAIATATAMLNSENTATLPEDSPEPCWQFVHI